MRFGDVGAGDRRRCRSVGLSRPARMCMSVDLPEPDGPITAANWPGGDVEGDAAEGIDGRVALAVAAGDVAGGDDGGGGRCHVVASLRGAEGQDDARRARAPRRPRAGRVRPEGRRDDLLLAAGVEQRRSPFARLCACSSATSAARRFTAATISLVGCGDAGPKLVDDGVLGGIRHCGSVRRHGLRGEATRTHRVRNATTSAMRVERACGRPSRAAPTSVRRLISASTRPATATATRSDGRPWAMAKRSDVTGSGEAAQRGEPEARGTSAPRRPARSGRGSPRRPPATTHWWVVCGSWVGVDPLLRARR